MSKYNTHCDQCGGNLPVKAIIGIEGQDIALIVGKIFCDMDCAEAYIHDRGSLKIER